MTTSIAVFISVMHALASGVQAANAPRHRETFPPRICINLRKICAVCKRAPVMIKHNAFDGNARRKNPIIGTNQLIGKKLFNSSE